MIFSADTLITLLDALQLVALAPCLFVIAFLLLTVRRAEVVVPCLYFLALAAGFLLPLLSLWPQLDYPKGDNLWLRGGLVFVQSLLPALSFLLIVQFARGRVPPLPYWGILALPLVGGSGLVYAALLADELCLGGWKCIASDALGGLYATFSNALIFLLLVMVFARARKERRDALQESNRYWLIVALIGLNLLVTAVDLLRIGDRMDIDDAQFVTTLLRMTFIYVVLTMLFRVFDRRNGAVSSSISAEEEANQKQDEKDKALIEGFEQLMQQYYYRDMECNRMTVAKALGVHENTVSRVINKHYDARFTDVVNQYRVREAQHLLETQKEQSITDIAFEVGFNSIPSFNRVFKESCGVTPTEYRNGKRA